MQREESPARPDWRARLEKLEFTWHTLDGQPYWVEDRRYRFTVREIDVLEAATADLHKLCLDAVEHVVAKRLYGRFGIAEQFWPYIEKSWRRADPTIYGRFDLAYDGSGYPKMLEYNADTPTALYEAAVIQWYWLQDVKPSADQFNSIHEKLIEAWRGIAKLIPSTNTVHFASMQDFPEDFGTSEYLRDCAQQAGLRTVAMALGDIGWNGNRFTDLAEQPIQALFKLYPWEWLARDKFADNILTDATAFIEPAWKMLLSNKAILPLLWELNEGHPNLLAASTTPEKLAGQYVKKPMLGREGRNVAISGQGGASDGPYGAEGFIYQALQPLPVFDGYHAVIGSWVIAGQPAGIGVREDKNPITGNTSLFVPHYF